MTNHVNLTALGLWAVILAVLAVLAWETLPHALLAGVVLVAGYLIGRLSTGGGVSL